MTGSRSRDAFERWFCEHHKLTQFPRPEHRPEAFKRVPTNLEMLADDEWVVWQASWNANERRC